MAHYTTLTWVASPDAVSYDIYRGTSAGKENATPIATGIVGTTYQDNAVVAGQTYYYYVTAVNGVNQSGPSNEANDTIPFAAPSNLTAVGE